ncbi:hypothetical protein [Tsukamurella soli]
MGSIEESAAARAKADFHLWGMTPHNRRISAQIVVEVARRKGEEPEQWVLDVAEGRLPA